MMRKNVSQRSTLGIMLLLLMVITGLVGCSTSNQDAATQADAELARVTAAQTAYTAAGGEATDPVYVDVANSEAALKAAKTTNKSSDILAASEDLKAKLNVLATATEALSNAAAVADAELAQVVAAQQAYTAAGGSPTDAVYADVAGAEATLKAAKATNKAADMQAATENLKNKLTILNNATQGIKDQVALENAKAAANGEIAKVAGVQADYIAIGGSATDPVYVQLAAAHSAVNEAKNAGVTEQIVAATATLTARLEAVSKNTAGFKDALQRINAGNAKLEDFETTAILGITSDNIQKAQYALAGARAVKGAELTRQEIQTAVEAVIK